MRQNVSTAEIGKMIKQCRKALRVTQQELALTSGTGIRFIVDIEKGKETCQIGKVLSVLQTLGISLQFDKPVRLGDDSENSSD